MTLCQVLSGGRQRQIIIASRPFEKRHIQLMRHNRPAVMRWVVQVGCVLSLDVPLASGGCPPGFNPLWRGWVYRSASEAPLLRGMPMGSEAFLEMPGACGLRPCAWIHLKKGFVQYSSGWWVVGQIPSLRWLFFFFFFLFLSNQYLPGPCIEILQWNPSSQLLSACSLHITHFLHISRSPSYLYCFRSWASSAYSFHGTVDSNIIIFFILFENISISKRNDVWATSFLTLYQPLVLSLLPERKKGRKKKERKVNKEKYEEIKKERKKKKA